MQRKQNESFTDYRFRRAKEQLITKLKEGGRFKGTDRYAYQEWFTSKYRQLLLKFGR